MGSRVYTVSGSNITVLNAAVTLVLINPPSGRTIQIVRAEVTQHANAVSAQQRIILGSKASAFGTYTAATPALITTGDPVSKITGGTAGAAGTAGINASAEGGGTLTTIIPSAFNTLNGYLWVPTPDEVLTFCGADSLAFAMQFPVAPGTLTGWNFCVTFKEVG